MSLMNFRHLLRYSAAASLLAAAAAVTHAAPINVQLTGTIDSVSSGPFVVGAGVQADLWFDLDGNNALQSELVPSSGPSEPAFKRWTFSGTTNSVSPYNQTNFTGGIAFSNPDFLDVEIIDDLDLSTVGNPFGLSGVVDVLSVFAITDVVDCTGGTIDPLTGACSIANAPILSGEHHGVNFVADSSWFTGINDLPAAMLPLSSFVAIVGRTEIYTNGPNPTHRVEIVYAASSVPAPAPTLLVGLGMALLIVKRRKHYATLD